MVALQFMFILLAGRVLYIQAIEGEYLQARAYEQQTRDRLITPQRGAILDRNMVGLAVTETVASVSVVRAQVRDPEGVAKALSEKLEMDYEEVLEKVTKRVALMRIKQKVDLEVAEAIRALNLPGVMVDEDILRVYPFSSLAAQIIGFVGRDNQGIIGLEAKYEAYLKGSPGRILTETDVAGREVRGGRQYRVPPTAGHSLVTTLDVVLQQYAEQTIAKIVEEKQALRGVIILMNPQTGEIYALANKPDFDLNAPFTIQNPALEAVWDTLTDQQRMNALNQMWRNFAINDTYEPGSTFKIVTTAAGFEEQVMTLDSTFHCGGSMTVGGRMIRCWRYPRAHGALTFAQGVQHSCNPVFMSIGERLGAEVFHDYLIRFGFNEKTGVDLPGEAVGIMYAADKIGPVELATMSFGQSLAITPLQLLRAGAAIINGGYMITPHVGTRLIDENGHIVQEFRRERGEQVISTETSEIMKFLLESVVYEGTGRRTYIPGFRIGGKTATSQKLPRGSGKYISSFMTFAPAENPQVIALVLIDEPKGAYYGGQVAGPVMKELLENALPYLNIQPRFNEEEMATEGVPPVILPDIRGQTKEEVAKILQSLSLGFAVTGDGNTVVDQFPMPGDLVNQGQNILLRVSEVESESRDEHVNESG
ncbi:MAG: penicillin-binding transpeptidase domain-containing protein [Defluviitaleaceae bacterium]|nr:penicillin-binding transpeptidase domain-containing protein [Defluviitaleaceae bacterium]